MSNDQIQQWTSEVGIEFQTNTGISGRKRTTTCGSTTVEVLQAFATLVRNATLEEAAAKCESLAVTDCNDSNVTRKECATVIRGMKS